MKKQKHTPRTCSALSGREVAQILGLVSALAAMTYATPSLIIRSLSGVLWTSAEEKELLAEASIFDPLMRRITEDMLRTPNNTDHAQKCTDIPADGQKPTKP